ncbi:MAG: hypothetical protein K6E91_10915 [Butyrivibrio sp.]|nr:hypothetical protein [Butyrivibrio sp.]
MIKKHPYLTELVVFFVALAIAVASFYSAVRYKNVGSGGGMDNFYAAKVPIDVIIYGSSHAACTVNNGLLWEENGIASYTLSAGGQQVDGTYYFIQESIANNKPKVALVETYLFGRSEFALDAVYRSSLTSKFSTRFVSYVFELARNFGIGREQVEELLFRLPIVHSRYRELTRSDFINEEPYIRGYRGDDTVFPVEVPVMTTERAELSDYDLGYIDRIIKTCKDNGVSLVFFNAPCTMDEENMARQNSVRDYVEEQGYPYLAFNHEYEKYGIDFENDLRDTDHLNDVGSNKVTAALRDYIVENFDIPDRRSQEGYENWDLQVKYLADRGDMYRLRQITETSDYLDAVSEYGDRYTTIVVLDGNYDALGEGTFADELAPLGIDDAAYERGGAFVVENGQVVASSDNKDVYALHMDMGERAELNIYKTAKDEFCHTILADRDYSSGVNGLTVIVYDKSLRRGIDGIYTDVYLGTQAEHVSFDE